MTTVMPTEQANWRMRALCRDVDPETFYPLPNAPQEDLAQVLAICNGCPVRDACRQWADDNGVDTGIWGGETEQERRRRLGRNRATVKPPGLPYQVKVNAVRRLAGQGHPDSAISTAIGIPQSTVTSIRRQYKIPAGTQIRRQRQQAVQAGLSRQAADRLTAGAR